MKKRLIGSLLLGAFFVASTSMFVSCKDYDDDIKDLQAQIDANKNSLSKLQAAIQQGSILKSVTPVSMVQTELMVPMVSMVPMAPMVLTVLPVLFGPSRTTSGMSTRVMVRVLSQLTTALFPLSRLERMVTGTSMV